MLVSIYLNSVQEPSIMTLLRNQLSATTASKNRLFRVPASKRLHSFAALRNWLRQPLQSLPQFKTGTDLVGQTHYKMISCNIWLPVVIHRSKTRNNALDVFWGIETIIMPLSRQPQKKSFCPVSHSLAPTFMKIFFIMRLP